MLGEMPLGTTDEDLKRLLTNDKPQDKTSEVGQYRVEERFKDKYVICHPKDEDDHECTLIWLHGLADSAPALKDMFLKKELCYLPEGCKVVIPTGNVHRIYAMGFKDMISWFNVYSYHEDREEPMVPSYFKEHYC
jgi:hypothetical protein